AGALRRKKDSAPHHAGRKQKQKHNFSTRSTRHYPWRTRSHETSGGEHSPQTCKCSSPFVLTLVEGRTAIFLMTSEGAGLVCRVPRPTAAPRSSPTSPFAQTSR